MMCGGFKGSHDPSRHWISSAFTLVELLVVVTILAILAGLILPSLNQSKSKAYKVKCANGLRQLGLAAMMYWDDNEGRTFKYIGGAKDNGTIYWFGWIERGSEGERRFNPQDGALYPYLKGRGVEICPSFNYQYRKYKLKATGASYGYGYNFYLGEKPMDSKLLLSPSATLLFGDSAQVNVFQAPASPSNPMLEEFYYLNKSEPTAHFRHSRLAEIVFCDGHVESSRMLEGSLDSRLPEARVGLLPTEFFELW
jgi:prepilin-type N-terminal cleavage/methylation domain-containing protein/prepilin-type processing-associated H-X9-DG protein